MNLKSKVHLELQKAAAEKGLAAQRALCEQRGLDPAAMQRSASIRQAKAAVRKINQRLAAITAQEAKNAERARTTAEKAAPAETPEEQPPKKAKKAKKEG